jgi:hypothetical protein
MTLTEIQKTLYLAFYRVIRIGVQPTLAQFLDNTVKGTWPDTQNNPTPGDFPDFWWHALELEIQKSFMAQLDFWDELDVALLQKKFHDNVTWKALAQEAFEQHDSLSSVI